MNADLETMLIDSLHARADAGTPVDPQAILHTAVRHGRKIRARRRIAAGAALGAAVVVTGLAVSATLVSHPRDTTAAHVPDPSSTGLSAVDLALLPDASGQPGASERPDLIATDSRYVHFSVDALAGHSIIFQLSAHPDYETAEVQSDGFQLFVALSSTREVAQKQRSSPKLLGEVTKSPPAPINVADRPGTLTIGTPSLPPGLDPSNAIKAFDLLWQPVDGFWAHAEVHTTTVERALLIAREIRFDQAKRCAFPLTVPTLPPAATVQSCTVTLTTGPSGFLTDVGLTIGDERNRLSISVIEVPGAKLAGPLRAGPHSVIPDPDGKSWSMTIGDFGITATLTKGAYTQDQVLHVLGAMRSIGDPRNPATW